MSVVKINAITPIEGKESELEERFGHRRRDVDEMEGFEGFALLRPLKGESRYFVFTRWRSEGGLPALGQQRLVSPAPQPGQQQSRATGATLLAFEMVEWPALVEQEAA